MTKPTLAHGAMPELMACPFCGGESFLKILEPHEHHFILMPPYPGGAVVECSLCNAGLIDDTADAVATAWNRRAAVEQAPVAVPEGMRLVPIEPTPAMLEASLRVFEWGWVEPCPELLECGVPVEMGITQEEAGHINAENMKEQAKIYAAMLAAAPQPDTGDSVHLGGGECGSVQVPLLFSRRKAIADRLGIQMTPQFNAIVRAVELAHDIDWCPATAPGNDAPTSQINPGSAPREDGDGLG